MSRLNQTRQTLLLRHSSREDEAAWEQFVEIYMPPILSFCFKRGLQHADAADVAQEVMADVARSIRDLEYDLD